MYLLLFVLGAVIVECQGAVGGFQVVKALVQCDKPSLMIQTRDNLVFPIPRFSQRLFASRPILDVRLTPIFLVAFESDIPRHPDNELRNVSNLFLSGLSRHSVENLVCELLRKRALIPLE